MPLGETACAQVLERPPDLRGVTQQAQPVPAVPRPRTGRGTLTVLTKVAQRRTECFFPGGIMYLPTLRRTGFTLRCSVSPRQEESLEHDVYQYVKRTCRLLLTPRKTPGKRASSPRQAGGRPRSTRAGCPRSREGATCLAGPGRRHAGSIPFRCPPRTAQNTRPRNSPLGRQMRMATMIANATPAL